MPTISFAPGPSHLLKTNFPIDQFPIDQRARRVHSLTHNLTVFKLTSLLLLLLAAVPIHSFAQTYTVLASFDSKNGTTFNPGVLAQSFDGNLYGTSAEGGTNKMGTVFKITPQGVLTKLHDFCSEANCADGGFPRGGLLLGRDGNLYGTTSESGADHDGGGTIFKITPDGTLTTLYSFCQTDCSDGAGPSAPLIQTPNGNFYGTTQFAGGSAGFGTIFQLSPAGVLKTLYVFCGANSCTAGFSPNSGLVWAPDLNLFFGLTPAGEPENAPGSIFKITTSGKLTVLDNFCYGAGCVGKLPFAGLVRGIDGNFYGATNSGPDRDGSSIFKMTPGGTLTVMETLCDKNPCPDGGGIDATLVSASDGNLYGTTTAGGNSVTGRCPSGCGTIFKFTLQGTYTALFRFCGGQTNRCPEGYFPSNQLLQATDGSFYGMTNDGGTFGGANGRGVIYKFDAGLPPFVKPLPTTGKAGVNVVILGNNLTGTTAVDFNGTTATFKVVSNTEITAKVPAGATTGSVTVTTSSGTLTSNVAFVVP
jgi:uncharacterized repeat protein (TIGR03803 family)